MITCVPLDCRDILPRDEFSVVRGVFCVTLPIDSVNQDIRAVWAVLSRLYLARRACWLCPPHRMVCVVERKVFASVGDILKGRPMRTDTSNSPSV